MLPRILQNYRLCGQQDLESWDLPRRIYSNRVAKWAGQPGDRYVGDDRDVCTKVLWLLFFLRLTDPLLVDATKMKIFPPPPGVRRTMG